MDNNGKICPQHSTLPILLLCLSLSTHLCPSSDTITVNQSLSGNRTLTSSGGNFALGFFSPGNSSYSYVGIWYGKVPTQTVAYVANRDNPIRDRYSSELKISGGNVVIIDDSGVPIWTTRLTPYSGSSSMVAVLKDDGNFVVKDGPNSSDILWQSFDHPTHTWLPGAKLAYNKRTNTSQLLTSWKNQDDPATGQAVILVAHGAVDLVRVSAQQQCEVYNLCGPFGVCIESIVNFCSCLPWFSINSVKDWGISDWSGGCKRSTNLNCMVGANAEKDRFLQSDNVKLPTNSQTLSVGSLAACETACSNNCSCKAYAFNNNACQIWIGNLFNVHQVTQSGTGGKTLYLWLAASDVLPSRMRGKPGGSSNKKNYGL